MVYMTLSHYLMQRLVLYVKWPGYATFSQT
jgi:hypothetical protein